MLPVDNESDDSLELQTVRTAATTIRESIRDENRRIRKRDKLKKFFRSKRRDKAVAEGQKPAVSGKRRMIYVNKNIPAIELTSGGDPIMRYVRNKVQTTSELPIGYVLWLPLIPFQSTQF